MNMECNILGSRRYSGTEGFKIGYEGGKMKSRVWVDGMRYQSQPSFSSMDWEHICSTWNPTAIDKVKVYINGALEGSSAATSASSSESGDWKIILGGLYTDPPNTNNRDFVMDEFAFWHRDVLSDQEINDLFDSYII